MEPNDIERLPGVIGDDNRVPLVLEEIGQEFGDAGLIIYNEYHGRFLSGEHTGWGVSGMSRLAG